MIRCGRCQHENRAGRRFCAECGAPLAAPCAACGFANEAGERFCGGCGAPLGEKAAPAPPVPDAPAGLAVARGPLPGGRAARVPYTPGHLAEKILRTRSAIEGERRPVTVLFADLAGFTTMAERLDPEEVHRIVEQCLEAITAEIHRFEGTINQYTGDGVMALFGAPIAHEDAPRRAVHAALGIQRAIAEVSRTLQAQGGPALQMRIGVHTGPVVIGRVGDDLRMDYTAVGDTTNLASRLEGLARPGAILISEATHRLVAGYVETLDAGELAVKGRSPVHAWEVLRARPGRSRIDVAADRGLTPLVGREDELEVLRERFEDVKAGRGQVVFLVGDAGIGKSRLLHEFRRRLAEAGEPVTWLEGQCVSFGQSIPFLPIVDQLRRNFDIGEFDGEPEIIAKVEHRMRRMGGLEPHIPYIRALLSADPGDPDVATLDPQSRRRRIFDAVQALSVRGAERRPLALVVEDLHWADASSEEYLASVMDAVATVPMMLILTHRTGYAAPFGSRSFYTTVSLRSLSEGEALAMARTVLGDSELPAGLVAALRDKAEGVPLFVEEITRTLLDLGVLRREAGGYRMVRGLDTLGVPDTIQGIIMARLDRLGEDGKRTVQMAAVIGRQFLRRLLERVSGRRGQLDGLLAELKALEIVYQQGRLPEPSYIFKHAVIQDVAYESLLVQRRRELHRAVGAAIEELYADRLAEHYEELAHHFTSGQEWGKAFEYLERSGDKARLAFASQAALEVYARALEAASRVTPPVGPERIAQVHQRRAEIFRLLSRYPEAIAELERMRAVARDASDRRLEGEALTDLALAHWLTFSWDHVPETERCAREALAIAGETGDLHVRAKSLSYLGLVDQVHGQLAVGDEKLLESLRLAEEGGFKDVVVQDQLWLGAHANWRGDFGQAIALSSQAERAAAANRDGFQELFALAFRCLGEIGLGRHGVALATIQDGLLKARERNSVFLLGRLTNTLGWLYQELGDFAGALEHDREGVNLGVKARNPNVEISSLINVAFDRLHLGQPREALTLLEEALTRVEKSGFGAHRWRWSNHLAAYLAETLLACGEPERALVQAESALAQALATGSLKYVARAHALRGEIALLAGAWAAAETDLAEATRIAGAIGYPTLTWQAGHLLARARAEGSRWAAAGAAASEALAAIDRVAAAAPGPGFQAAFRAWSRVQAAREELERIARRG